MNNVTVLLSEVIKQLSVEEIGGKIWRLSAALAKGVPVPNGIAIPHQFLENANEDERRTALRQTLESLDESSYYAVRSSSNFEDHSIASGAGIFKSMLAVKGIDNLIEAVLECWNELSSPLVQRYAERLGTTNLFLHILIQEMIMPKRSGVAIINRPQHEEFIAEGVWGLGAGVVAGDLNPDFVSAQLENAIITNMRRGNQRAVMLASLKGDTYYDAMEVDLPVFDQSFVFALSHFLRGMMSMFGMEQEIEWAEDADGTIWMLQIRPLTNASSFRAC